jgi:hypothetical protein
MTCVQSFSCFDALGRSMVIMPMVYTTEYTTVPLASTAETEQSSQHSQQLCLFSQLGVCVCVCVCVRGRGQYTLHMTYVFVCGCLCLCIRGPGLSMGPITASASISSHCPQSDSSTGIVGTTVVVLEAWRMSENKVIRSCKNHTYVSHNYPQDVSEMLWIQNPNFTLTT